ncbi:hypothetical protein [Marinomonas algicola]|uniref:hypothetical protein n=1 Tax=Marinomonas algicola TaxID=2773454 RepID=UPI00174A7DE9|nr:hypothetical protein [Marinomonas algicola]
MFGLSKLHKRRERMYANCLVMEQTANKARQKYLKQTLETAASPKGLLAGFAVGFTSNCGTTKGGHYQLVKSVQKELFQLLQQGLITKTTEVKATEVKATDASHEQADDQQEPSE